MFHVLILASKLLYVPTQCSCNDMVTFQIEEIEKSHSKEGKHIAHVTEENNDGVREDVANNGENNRYVNNVHETVEIVGDGFDVFDDMLDAKEINKNTVKDNFDELDRGTEETEEFDENNIEENEVSTAVLVNEALEKIEQMINNAKEEIVKEKYIRNTETYAYEALNKTDDCIKPIILASKEVGNHEIVEKINSDLVIQNTGEIVKTEKREKVENDCYSRKNVGLVFHSKKNNAFNINFENELNNELDVTDNTIYHSIHERKGIYDDSAQENETMKENGLMHSNHGKNETLKNQKSIESDNLNDLSDQNEMKNNTFHLENGKEPIDSDNVKQNGCEMVYEHHLKDETAKNQKENSTCNDERKNSGKFTYRMVHVYEDNSDGKKYAPGETDKNDDNTQRIHTNAKADEMDSTVNVDRSNNVLYNQTESNKIDCFSDKTRETHAAMTERGKDRMLENRTHEIWRNFRNRDVKQDMYSSSEEERHLTGTFEKTRKTKIDWFYGKTREPEVAMSERELVSPDEKPDEHSEENGTLRKREREDTCTDMNGNRELTNAGDNHHFHPTCAKCSKCGDLFGDGEEMYVQGGAIWHPKCGPGPLDPSTVRAADSSQHLNGGGPHHDESGREFDRMSSSAASELQFAFRSRTPSFGSIYNPNTLSRKYTPYSARAGSPGLLLREYAGTGGASGVGSHKSSYPDDLCMIHTYSYLTEEPTKGYLRRPIDPYDKPPTSPHFHRPHSSHSHRASSRSSTGKSSLCGSRSGGGMRAILDTYRTSETPRARSPHAMNNEEPISLAHFPAAKPPPNNEVPKIERDDFPAPPYPYSDPERRRRWSDSYKGVPVSDDEDEVDNAKTNGKVEPIQKLKKEEEELSKIASGIGKVFLRNVKEREKLQKWKQAHLDPRNASRTPSATKEPVYRLRYQSPINASPSRNLDAPRPWEEDEFDRTSSYRSSVGRSTGAIHSYNVVSSYRHNVPKPGYTMAPHRSHTFSSAGATSQTAGDFSLGGLGDKTHSTNFSSGKSDVSNGSLYDLPPPGGHHTGGGVLPAPAELPASSTYAGSLGYAASYSAHIQRSLPNMCPPLSSLEPPKIYPYHLLIISNYRLPPDVDRNNLERHLSDVEFETLFLCSRSEFYRLPQWRRNELKKRARLF